MEFNTVLGIVATCFTTAAFLPQVLKVVKTENTQSISLIFIFIKTTASILWTTYGIMIENKIIIISCAIILSCTGVIFGYKLKNIVVNKEKI